MDEEGGREAGREGGREEWRDDEEYVDAYGHVYSGGVGVGEGGKIATMRTTQSVFVVNRRSRKQRRRTRGEM